MPTRWMADAKLRALFHAGLTYDEIAEANERSEGWRPSRSGVKRKYERMGMPPRRHSSQDLIPWRISQQHHDARMRHMLQAESRKRAGAKLSDTDRKLVAMLHDLCFGRGKLLVVGYDSELGFYLAEREDSDDDIIRAPRHARDLKATLKAAVSKAADEELARIAAEEGLTPELLENAGRDHAADLLRKLTVPPDANSDTGDAGVEEAMPPVPRPVRRRRTG